MRPANKYIIHERGGRAGNEHSLDTTFAVSKKRPTGRSIIDSKMPTEMLSMNGCLKESW